MYRNQAIERTNHLAGPSDASRSGAYSVDNTASENDPSALGDSSVELQGTRASLLENGFTSEMDSAYRSIASVESATAHEVCTCSFVAPLASWVGPSVCVVTADDSDRVVLAAQPLGATPQGKDKCAQMGTARGHHNV